MTRILDMAQSLAERFYQQGVSHEEVGAVEKAMRAFRRAVEADGSHVDARLALAYHCHRLNRLDEAITHCKQLLASRPCAAAYFSLGHLLIAGQQYAAALSALRRCLELEPRYEQARYLIAFIYYLQGEYEVAITEFHRVALREADWETLFFLAECYRMTRRPAEAERFFHRARGRATTWGQVELTHGQITACQRLAEFSPHHTLTLKDRVYCDSGVIYLGTASDDGIAIPPHLFYHFSYQDVARTLERLLALKGRLGWIWQAVVPVDIVSLPLALALAKRLGVGTEPRKGGHTLVVQGLGETVEGLQDAVERPGENRTFCLLASWPEEWYPDLVGLTTPIPGSLPWYHPDPLPSLSNRTEGRAIHPWMDSRPPETIANEILSAMGALPPERQRAAQLRYYEQHPRLRWT